jgi:L-alanine-DL-glutamate epimerase-like enolase superfamily enzyme
VGSWAAVADLPLVVEACELELLERPTPSGWTRQTTLIRLHGRGETGIGEDVVYQGEEHVAQVERGPAPELSGAFTLASFSELVGGLDLFPDGPPQMPVSRSYRRWGYESAALDLALRQAGRGLADVLGRTPRRVSFVNSMGLGEPSSLAPVLKRSEHDPLLFFKLDARSDWDEELVRALAKTRRIAVVDLKGRYVGTVVDQPADPALYRLVAEDLHEAWIEDPGESDETDAILEPHAGRITWDEPVHSIEDVLAFPVLPRMINVKPCRSGSIQRLFDLYDGCAERGIGTYGGGSFELGAGRGHLQALASIFSPFAPNDVAPGGYNDVELAADLPRSPLEPRLDRVGFRWVA